MLVFVKLDAQYVVITTQQSVKLVLKVMVFPNKENV